jgi:hypothetical protein
VTESKIFAQSNLYDFVFVAWKLDPQEYISILRKSKNSARATSGRILDSQPSLAPLLLHRDNNFHKSAYEINQDGTRYFVNNGLSYSLGSDATYDECSGSYICSWLRKGRLCPASAVLGVSALFSKTIEG